MAEQPLSPRLERLHLQAVTSGWQPDWDRYHAAEEAERQARLAVLELESTGRLATLRADLRAAGWSAEVVRLSDEDRAEMVWDYGTEGV